MAENGLILYRIANNTGVVKTSLMRLMDSETSLRLDMGGVLTDYLGLELTKRKAK